MKSYKPSYSYGATEGNYSSHNYQAQDCSSGRPKGGDVYGHGLANKPTKYFAQAQCAQPSPSVHVVQGSKVVETIIKQETVQIKERSSPTQATHSEFAAHEEKHIVGNMDQSCANQSTQFSGAAHANQYGLAMHKEEHMMGKAEQGWANKPTQFSGAAHTNQYGLSMHKEEHVMQNSQQGWANKPTQYSGVAQSNQQGFAMHKEEHMMGKVDQGWANKPAQHSGTVQASQYEMHNGGQMMGKMEQGWANKPNHYSGTTQGNQYGHAMHEEEHMMGNMENSLAHKFSASANRAQVNGNLQSMYKEQDGDVKNGWARKPNNYYGSQPSGYSSQSAYKDNERHQWAENTDDILSPIHTNRNELGAYKENHMMAKMDHGFSGSNQANRSGLGMYQEVGKLDHGFSGSNQTNHSSLGMYKEEHAMGKMDHVVIGSPNPLSHHGQLNQNGQSMYNQHGLHEYNHNSSGQGSGWANKSNKYSGQNQYGYTGQNQLGYSAQNQHGYSGHDMYNEGGSYGKSNTGYGAAQTNHSAHTAYNCDDHEDGEGLHEIMDEILTKYPAHSVSSGHGSKISATSGACMGQNQVGSYSKQQSFGGPAHYGTSAAQYSSKFEMKKQVGAGYKANVMQEYAHSSSSKKFEMNNGGLSNRGIPYHDDECDY